MILKSSLFIFLFGTVIGGAIEDGTTFNIENVWKSSKTDGAIRPVYLDGIQKYYVDIIESFSKFPSDPSSNDTETVTTAFRNFLSVLVIFSYSNSTVISSSSVTILETLNNVNISVKTPLGVIEEFYRMLPILMVSYRSLVSDLSNSIGGLADVVNVALTELELSFKGHMTEFLRLDERGLRKQVDFKPIARNAQKLANTISLIAATTQNKCELGASDIDGVLITLTLVLDHLMICFHGLSGCSHAVLSEQKSDEPVVPLGFHSTVIAFNSGINKSLLAITSNEKSITEFSTNLAHFTDVLNTTLNNLFGEFSGIAVTAEEITQNMSKKVSGVVCGVTNPITNTLGGLGRRFQPRF